MSDRPLASAILAVLLAACASTEAPLPLASAALTEEDCRGDVLAPARLFVDPAEPDGQLILVDREGAGIDARWDPRMSVRRVGDGVEVRGLSGVVPGERMALIGSRLSGGGFLVCDVRPAN